METFFLVITTFGDRFTHTYLNNSVWVAIVGKNSFDVVQLLW